MNKFKKGSASTCRRQDGFTLIELLVVVAIIGILAAVILASTSTSRAKAADAAVKSNLNTVKGQSEIFYYSNSNSFLPSGGTALIPPLQPCPAQSDIGGNMFARDKVINSAIREAEGRGSGISRCYNTANYWVVAVGLKSNGNNSWCIDSGGASRKVLSSPALAINPGGYCN